ncbi:hypothetical protein ABE10_00115 [Bacillus toyonensis]|nr:hypothetical protein [Bacillus toyonensis]
MVLQDAAVPADQGGLCTRDLALAAVASQLQHGFAQRREAPHVERGELSSARVARETAPRTETSFLDEGPAFAFRAEPVVLQGHEDRVGIAVVQLDHVQVVERDPGHRRGTRPRIRSSGDKAPGGVVPQLSRAVGLSVAAHLDRRAGEIVRPFTRGDDHGDRAVADHAAVQASQWSRDPR